MLEWGRQRRVRWRAWPEFRPLRRRQSVKTRTPENRVPRWQHLLYLRKENRINNILLVYLLIILYVNNYVMVLSYILGSYFMVPKQPLTRNDICKWFGKCDKKYAVPKWRYRWSWNLLKGKILPGLWVFGVGLCLSGARVRFIRSLQRSESLQQPLM
jgi:hypothetical protein